jgi:hypothetical protein
MAQTTLDHLESQIRDQTAQNGTVPPTLGPGGSQMPMPPTTPYPRPSPGGRAYLGAVADDKNDRGRGVRVMSVRPGGPADVGGLRPQDLIVGATGTRVRQLSDLTAVMDLLSPGDKLALDVIRVNRTQRVEITLGQQSAATPTGPMPPGSTPPSLADRAPLPPQDTLPVPPSLDGPTLMPKSGSTLPPTDANRVEYLQRRVDQLERRVEELERSMNELRRK